MIRFATCSLQIAAATATKRARAGSCVRARAHWRIMRALFEFSIVRAVYFVDLQRSPMAATLLIDGGGVLRFMEASLVKRIRV